MGDFIKEFLSKSLPYLAIGFAAGAGWLSDPFTGVTTVKIRIPDAQLERLQQGAGEPDTIQAYCTQVLNDQISTEKPSAAAKENSNP